MGIKLARTAGFCMGVKRAVDIVLDVAQRKGEETVYTYGPLIHNPQTVALLKRRGIIPVDSLDKIGEDARGSLIIIRAHGVSPAVRRIIRQKGLRIVDATCPKVGHVQSIIKKHAGQGYHVLIVGDEAHPEVNGLLGYAAGRGIVVSHAEAVDDLPEMEKVCVVAQTTQDMDAFEEITGLIKARFPNAVVFDTICDSTEMRQREVKELAGHMDAMIVVGGHNSANTQRLAALARSQGVQVFHIETAEELEGPDIGKFENIGISAGASTPNWIIDRVVADVTAMQKERTGKAKLLFKIWTTALRTDVYSAVGAACLSLAAILLQGIPLRFPYPAIAALYVYAMHTINRIVDRRASTVLGSFREVSYERHKGRYATAAAASLAAALILAAWVGMAPFVLLLIMSVLGVLYNAPIFPRGWRFRYPKDVPGSKNTSMAFAWAVVTAVLPRVSSGFTPTAAMVVAFLFVFGLVFVRSVLSDVLDVQSDRLIGRETIPVLMGTDNTRILIKAVSLLTLVIISVAYSAGWATSLALPLVPVIFYLWICFRLCDTGAWLSGLIMEGIIETSYVLTGLIGILWLVWTGPQ